MFHWGKKEAVNSERIKTLSQGLQEYFEQNYTGSTEADLSAWRPPEYTYHGAADAASQNDIPDMAEPPLQASNEPSFSYHRRLEDILKEADETFVERLFRYADERELTDSQLYRKSHIDKRHFGKIKNGEIKPVKDVVIAFILGLELNLDEAEDLLRSAGFTLSTSIRFDLAIKYFIKNGIYNTIEINEVLEDQKLPTLRYY